MSESRFLSVKDQTDKWRAAVRLLKLLGFDLASRAYAEAYHCFIWEKVTNGSKPSRAHKCPRSLRRKVCGQGKESEEFYCSDCLPGPTSWLDHATIWNDEHGRVLYGQPYEMNIEDLQRIVRVCEKYELDVSIRADRSWHFPGSTILVEMRPERARSISDAQWARQPWSGLVAR